MAERQVGVLSLVERGWQGARECSLVLSQRGIAVTHLIKGSLGRDLRAMIQPIPHVRIVDVPRYGFRLAMWWHLLVGSVRGTTRWVLVDHERTLREVRWWCRFFRVTRILIQPDGHDYVLFVEGRAVSLQDIIGVGGGAGASLEDAATSGLQFQSTCSEAGTGGQTAVHTFER